MKNLAGLMKQASQMQAKMQEMQAKMEAMEVEGVAGDTVEIGAGWIAPLAGAATNPA